MMASLREWRMSFYMKKCSGKSYCQVSRLKMTYQVLLRKIQKISLQLFSWKKVSNFMTNNFQVWSNSPQVFAKSKSQLNRRDDSWICSRNWKIWREVFIFIKQWQKMTGMSVDSVAKILKLEGNLGVIFQESMLETHMSTR